MEHGYTKNFLVKYLYRETSALKSLEIENAINSDKEVERQYKGLLNGFKMLPKVKFYPEDNTIVSILKYSAGSRLEPSF
ncbi:MAG: hypothetical protein HKN67_04995 [Saprospiraceae bacterium]|nr:hypothetical protein [Saprospiraceae bacterium]